MKTCAAGLLLWLAACQKPPVHPAFQYQRDLGVAVEKPGHTCLYIAHNELSPGQRLQFVNAAPPQTSGEMQIVAKADDACKDTSQEHPGVIRYSSRVTGGALASPSIAVVNSSQPLTVADAGMAGDLEGDGHLEFFRACTSTEGVHLTVWKGQPLEGWRKWHYYYYLGYSVTPNCRDSDTKPDTEK
jgi:hypothetical protein